VVQSKQVTNWIHSERINLLSLLANGSVNDFGHLLSGDVLSLNERVDQSETLSNVTGGNVADINVVGQTGLSETESNGREVNSDLWVAVRLPVAIAVEGVAGVTKDGWQILVVNDRVVLGDGVLASLLEQTLIIPFGVVQTEKGSKTVVLANPDGRLREHGNTIISTSITGSEAGWGTWQG